MKGKNEKENEKAISVEFLKYISEHPTDCAEDVFKKAETPWEREVAIELFVNEKDRAVMKKDISHVKKMVWAIFTVVAVTAVANLVSSYLLPLLGVG